MTRLAQRIRLTLCIMRGDAWTTLPPGARRRWFRWYYLIHAALAIPIAAGGVGMLVMGVGEFAVALLVVAAFVGTGCLREARRMQQRGVGGISLAELLLDPSAAESEDLDDARYKLTTQCY